MIEPIKDRLGRGGRLGVGIQKRRGGVKGRVEINYKRL